MSDVDPPAGAIDTDERDGDPDADWMGTLYIVGIGPGLPHAMTQRAKDVVATADCVIASNLYQEFLRRDGTLPPEDALADGGVATRPDSTTQEIVRSSMGQQVELAKEAFERVRAGETVAHVSGGDPNVYGKSDLLFTMADAEIGRPPECGGHAGHDLDGDVHGPLGVGHREQEVALAVDVRVTARDVRDRLGR